MRLLASLFAGDGQNDKTKTVLGAPHDRKQEHSRGETRTTRNLQAIARCATEDVRRKT
jgi:hypothetical protein